MVVQGATTPTLFSRRIESAEQLAATRQSAPAAFVKGERVRLFLTSPDGVAVFTARWKRRALEGKAHTRVAAELKLERHAPAAPDSDSDWRPATVLPANEWPALARRAADLLTDPTPFAGTLVQLLNFESVLYHDDAGVLRETSLPGRPAGVTLDRTVTADEFAAAIVQTLEERGRAVDCGPVFLLSPGLDPARPDFMLVDVSRKLTVYLSAPMPPNDPRGRPRYVVNAKMLGSLTVESHLLGVLRNPVSALGRLANVALHAADRAVPPLLPTFPGPPPAVANHPPMDLGRLERALNRLTGTRQTRGTARLLIDGGQFFPVLDEALEAAQTNIHVQVSIFDTDDVAVDLADLLRRRSQEVDVRVLLDRMSSLAAAASPPASPMRDGFREPASIRSYLERGSAVKVRSYLNPWLSADHSKVWLVDDAVAFVGGMNVGREYRYEWHDLMVELRGPVVDQLAGDFRLAWAHAGPAGDLGYATRALLTPPRPTGAPPPPEAIALRVLKTQTLDHQIRAALFTAVGRAANHVFIENPYLTDRTVVKALIAARRRGVDVRVIIPNRNNMLGVESHNFVTANALLRNGVRVFIHPGMTHVKAALVDGWVLLGSANFNNFSLRLNQEVNVATSDPGFAAEVRTRLFEADFARAHELLAPIPVGWTDRLAERVLSQF